MAGRFGYLLIGGAALFAGMVVQGDIDFHDDDVVIHRSVKSDRAEPDIDRRIDRIVDRATEKIEIRGENGRNAVETPTEGTLAAAIAELVRAEGSLITARMDDDLPASTIKQIEQRRDAARQDVDRIAKDVRARSRDDRDALRQEIRDDVRETIRDAVRG